MRSKAFSTAKVGLDYVGSSAISLQKKIDINLQAWLFWGHYAFHNSALLDCSFAFLILVCYIRPVYQMSNFQIIAIALMSLLKDTFCLQLH